MGRLRGGVDRQLARRRRVVDQKGAALHGHRHVGLLVDGLGHHVGGRVEHLLQGGGGQARHLTDQVGAVELVHQCVRLLRRGVVDDRGQGVVVDLDQIDGVFGEVAALGDHQGHRVADEAHLALGQRGPRGLGALRSDRRVPLLLHVGVEVGRGENGAHPGQRQGRRGVDAADSGPGKGAADEAGVQHPR